MRLVLASIAALSAGVSFAATSSAEPRLKPLARLEYARGEGAESCPDELALRNTVAERLGTDPFWPAAPLSVSVLMHRSDGQAKAQIILRDARTGQLLGTRVLSSNSDDCRELFSAMALAVSIAIDAATSARATAAGAAPEKESAPLPEKERAPERSEGEGRDRASKPRAPTAPRAAAAPDRALPSVHLGALVGLGTSPVPAAGFSIGGGVRRGFWSAELEARADVPFAKGLGGLRFRASPFLLALVPCVLSDPLLVCLVGAGGFLRGETSDDPDVEITRLGLVGARFGADIPLRGRFSLRVYGELLGNLTPTTLSVHGQDVWSTSSVGGAFGAAAGASF